VFTLLEREVFFEQGRGPLNVHARVGEAAAFCAQLVLADKAPYYIYKLPVYRVYLLPRANDIA
jgi:hypothetical protein